MEVNIKSIIFSIILCLAACEKTEVRDSQITDVYVSDFGSEDIDTCRPSDVDLSHHQAKEYFSLARQVDHKVIHDHYNYAPCYIEGILKYNSKPCEWEIRAGATGHIKCGQVVMYFVCDTCEDLFESDKP